MSVGPGVARNAVESASCRVKSRRCCAVVTMEPGCRSSPNERWSRVHYSVPATWNDVPATLGSRPRRRCQRGPRRPSSNQRFPESQIRLSRFLMSRIRPYLPRKQQNPHLAVGTRHQILLRTNGEKGSSNRFCNLSNTGWKQVADGCLIHSWQANRARRGGMKNLRFSKSVPRLLRQVEFLRPCPTASGLWTRTPRRVPPRH